MLFPVLVLVLRRAVLDQLALAADLSTHRRPRRALPIRTRRRALATLSNGSLARRRILGKRHVAVDPIAHLARAHAAKGGRVPAAALEREHGGAVEAVAREADHLAVLRAARVGTPRGEVEEDVGGGDEERVREEDLRVGRRLVREEDYERRTPLVQDRAEDEVDLWEAGRAALELECVLQTRI